MITSNILGRVFLVKAGDPPAPGKPPKTASGFTIEVEGRQYFITARHVLDSFPSKSIMEISRNFKWEKFEFQSIQLESAYVDIAVLALKKPLSGILPVELGLRNVAVSQTVFFVGFPFGLSMPDVIFEDGFPIPLVKHGIISSLVDTKKGKPFFVDGMNNGGFSGGPLACMEGGITRERKAKIIGVVSGRLNEKIPVEKEGEEKTDFIAPSNAGFLVAFPVDYAIDAIKKNPIGFKIKPGP